MGLMHKKRLSKRETLTEEIARLKIERNYWRDLATLNLRARLKVDVRLAATLEVPAWQGK